MPVETAPADQQQPPTPEPEMSVKTMVLLGGAMTLGVALVLGLTLLVGGGSARSGRSQGSTAAGSVPGVVKLTSAKATALLASRRLAIGAVIKVPSALPAGQVVRTAPAVGSPVPEGSAITLYVSQGSSGEEGTSTVAKVSVPFLRGSELAQAQNVAGQLGLRIVVKGGSGQIVSQVPEAGAEVDRGTAVQVTLG
jgi:serine/threonine-protein kinase